MKRLILIFVSIFSIVFASQANTYTVTSNADNGTGTLRQAIQDASNNVGGAGPHTIIFSAGMTITLNNSLQLNADTDYNGLTINGFVDGVAGPDVVIRSNNQCGVRGFDINGSNTNMKFYGLVFQNLEYGIYFNASASGTVNGSEIKGCYFGTDITGSTIQNGICKSGITFIGVSSAIIGGPNTNLSNGTATTLNNSERCLFGGTCLGNGAGDNGRYGAIQLQNGSNNVSILNNYIGVNLAGTTVLPIGNAINKKPVTQNGISIDNTPSFNTIISNNVISGAMGSGISIFTGDRVIDASNGHVITGNIIGLDPTGTLGYNVTTPASSFGNQGSGIYIRNAANVTIGGSTPATRNVISANGGASHAWPDINCFAGWNDYNQIAVYLEFCVSTKVSGNYIGTNSAGTSSGIGTNNILGNRSGGIKIVGGLTGSNNNIIGGSNAGEGNVISGNGYLWGTFTAAPCPGSGVLSGISTGHGIVLQYADCINTSILGNYIGLTANGLTGLGNYTSGIDIQGARNNTIGGTTAGARNYICDNQFGITIQEDFDPASHNVATNNVVSGNYIGLNVNSAAVGNGVSASFTEGAGIVIQKGANLNTIGTAVAGGGNVISGNRSGIIIRNAEGAGSNTGTARNNTIQNNIIGLDPTGASAIPNTSATAGYGYGIQIEVGTGSATTTIPFGNIIGGTGANQANTISGNQKSGIYINSTAAVTASTANSIIGNKIGTNSVGTGDLGNTLQGIQIVNVNKTTITSNIISGNDQNGISLSGSTTNSIQTNTINANSVNGVLLTGSSTNTISGNTINTNGSNGISLTGSSSNTIQSNTINSNTSNGILLASTSASNIIDSNTINTNGLNGVTVNASLNNSIHKNSFSCNTGRGIVLTAGGNNNYAAPTIVGTPTQITWTGPTVGSIIEVYETDGCATCPADPTRLQGKTLIKTGTSPYVFDVAAGFDKTKTYTATASEAAAGTAHNTSEFSICYTLCQDPTSVTITGAPLTFCAGGSVTLTANVVGAGTGTPTYVWKRGGTVVPGSASTLVVSTAGSYTVQYSSTTTCGLTPPSAAVTVTVNPRPVINSSGTNTICSGDAQSYTITSDIPATYTWSRAAVTGITPSTNSGSTSTITEALTNTTTSSINVVYTINATSTTGSCSSVAAFSYTVTVNPKPAVINQAPAAICSGETFTVTPSGVPAGTTYSWPSPSVTGGTVSGASAQLAQTSISQTLVNNGSTVVTVVYTVTPVSGSCPGTPFTVTITVNPRPVIDSPATDAVCSGDAQSYTITSTVPSSFTWSRVAVAGITPATGSGSTSTITEALTNTTTSAINVVYTINATSTTGSCSSVAAFSYTVTVNPKPAVINQAPAAICSGETFTVTPSGVPASTTYSWAMPSVTGGTVSGASAQLAQTSISQTLVNNGSTVVTVVYTVTPVSGSCPGTPFTVTVTVNPRPVIDSPATDAVCSGDAQSYTITSTVPSSFTWSRVVVTGITPNTGSGSTSTITEALTNTTTSAIDVVYTISATSTTGSCSSVASFAYTVTVNPKATVTDQAPAAICSGGTFTVTPSDVPAGTTYSWADPIVTGGTVSGASAQLAQTSISQTLTNDGSTVATVVYTVTPVSGSCSGSSFTVTVTVNPTPTITSLPTGIVCSGIAQNYMIESNVAASYNWTRDVVSGIENPEGTGSSNPIAEVLVNSTNASIDVIYEIIPTSTAGSCENATPFIYTVTVNPKPVVTIAVSGTGETAICSTQTVELTATAVGFTGGTIEWFDGSTSLGNANPLPVNAAGMYTVVYTSTSSCVSLPSTAVPITIKPGVTEAVAPANFATCSGSASLVGNVPVVGVGSWSVVLPSTAVLTPGVTSNLADATNLVDGDIYTFIYKISNECGFDTAKVVVNAGLFGFVLAADGPTDTLCVLTNRTLTATASGGSENYSYFWVSSDGSFTSTTSSGTITVQPVSEETTYTVYVVDNSNPGCKTDSEDIKVHAVKSQDLDIPNLITPNGDNKNDIFILKDKVTRMDMIKEGSHIEVVNRWGSRVYEANNYDNNWVPKELTDGMYYYHITSTCGNKEYKSWLQILGNTNN